MSDFTGFPEAEFGKPKVFRPFRDVPFAKEKSTVNASRCADRAVRCSTVER